MKTLKNLISLNLISFVILLGAEQASAWTCVAQCKQKDGSLEQVGSSSFNTRAEAYKDIQKYCERRNMKRLRCFNSGNPSADRH